MPRYKVTFVDVTLVFEVDAPSAAAAEGALYNAFKVTNGNDPLEGTKFFFSGSEKECSNPRLMTTTITGRSAFDIDPI